MKNRKFVLWISVILLVLLLTGCGQNKTQYNVTTQNDAVELKINHNSFNVYKVKIDTMEYLVFRGTECISHERIK